MCDKGKTQAANACKDAVFSYRQNSMRFQLAKLAVCAALVFGVPGAFSQTRENPTEPIGSALRARDFDKAIELSHAALQTSPNNAQLWALQGIALAGKSDNANALVSFKHALKIDPNNVGAIAGAAQSAYATNNGKEAVPLLSRLLQLRPDEPTAHAMLAVLQYREGNCAGATEHFEKAGDLIRSEFDG